jgi:hypothetical protein
MRCLRAKRSAQLDQNHPLMAPNTPMTAPTTVSDQISTLCHT